MKRYVLIWIFCVAAVVEAAAAFSLTASKVTVQDVTVDKPNFFVTVEAATSTGEYEVAFDVWPSKRSVIGAFSAEDKTIAYVSSFVHKTKANGEPVNMWYYCEDNSEISLSIVSDGNGTCTLSGSIQAARNGTMYTYNIADFDFAYSEEGVEPEPEKDPYRFEPTQAVTLHFSADVVNFRERADYIEITLNEMANETYNWIELRLLSDTLALPVGTYRIDNSGEAGTLTASQGYLGGTKGDDPCYLAIRGDKEDWGQYTPYYLTGGSLDVRYNAVGDTIIITGTVQSHNGSVIHVSARSYNMLYVPGEQPKEPEHVTLSIDTVTITYLSNLSDSTANLFVYTLDFSQGDDYPNVIADVVLSKPMELVAGTYTMEDGSLNDIMLSQNQEDFEMNIFAGGAYEFTAATLTLSQQTGGKWQFEMFMEDIIGSTYRFTLVQKPQIIYYPQPEVDPKDKPYADEQKEPTTVTLDLDAIQWNSSTVAYDGILDIILSQSETGSNGLRAYVHLGMYTSSATPAAGTYPVNGSEAEGTFSASLGRYGNTLIPCYVALLDADGWAHAVWYITGGTVTLAYDEENQPVITGEGTTYFGSTIRFAYPSGAQGIENVQSDKVQSTKVLRNGMLYILHNGQMYDVMGRMME